MLLSTKQKEPLSPRLLPSDELPPAPPWRQMPVIKTEIGRDQLPQPQPPPEPSPGPHRTHQSRAIELGSRPLLLGTTVKTNTWRRPSSSVPPRHIALPPLEVTPGPPHKHRSQSPIGRFEVPARHTDRSSRVEPAALQRAAAPRRRSAQSARKAPSSTRSEGLPRPPRARGNGIADVTATTTVTCRCVPEETSTFVCWG